MLAYTLLDAAGRRLDHIAIAPDALAADLVPAVAGRMAATGAVTAARGSFPDYRPARFRAQLALAGDGRLEMRANPTFFLDTIRAGAYRSVQERRTAMAQTEVRLPTRTEWADRTIRDGLELALVREAADARLQERLAELISARRDATPGQRIDPMRVVWDGRRAIVMDPPADA